MKDKYFKRCKKLRKKLERQGSLLLVQNSDHYKKWQADLPNEELGTGTFTVRVTGHQQDPPVFGLEFFVKSMERVCKLLIFDDQQPEAVELETVGQYRKALEDLDAYLKHYGV